MAPQSPRAIDLELRTLRLRLWDHGGEGPLALCLHGYLDTGRSFDAVAELLAPHARVVALDFRGHGESDRAGAGASYHLLDHLKDAALATEALERGGVLAGDPPLELLLGHSMGGNVALLLAGSVPARVPRLLLVDSIGPPAEAPEDQPARLGRLLRTLDEHRPLRSVASREEAMQRVQRSNPGLSEQGAARMTAHSLRERDDGGFDFAFDPRLRGPVPNRHPESFWLALCGAVTATTVLLRAENGYVPEDEPTPSRLRAIRGAKLVTVPEAHHHLHVDYAEIVAREAQALLDRPGGTAAAGP